MPLTPVAKSSAQISQTTLLRLIAESRDPLKKLLPAVSFSWQLQPRLVKHLQSQLGMKHFIMTAGLQDDQLLTRWNG